MAGPREALWHGLIRKNHGCSHIIIGRDHAGPGLNSKNKPFYGPYDAQTLFKAHQEEMGIEMVDFRQMVYIKELDKYEPLDEISNKNLTTLNISGTELRRRLDEGLNIPAWFSFPEVVTELNKARPPKSSQGFTIFFTGLWFWKVYHSKRYYDEVNGARWKTRYTIRRGYSQKKLIL
jgi:sulfate adenylyltransferase